MNAATKPFIPPEYVFVSSDDIVQWSDAVVTWTIFYRKIIEVDFDDKETIQKLLNRLHKSGFGELKYYRWDETLNRYRRFQPKRN